MSLLDVTCHDDVSRLLASGAVVAIGVSGGKDSQACALAVHAHLEKIGHTGPRVLVHSDLGSVEWADSLPTCRRLAEHIGWELLVVERKAGGMMERWEARWANNVARYANLECVKLILPWSTPAMRFCTSELKVQVIASALKKRYPGQSVVNVTGVRRQESASRARMLVAQPNDLIVKSGGRGYTWNAIIDASLEDVFGSIAAAGLALHEGYRLYGMMRISCAFCIMAAEADLAASASCPENHAIYRRMVLLEATSTFAFQSTRWLADIAPHLLDSQLVDRIGCAKRAAQMRVAAEARVPRHLLYVKGWPVAVPTWPEASLLASVRAQVADAVQLAIAYTNPGDIIARYEELIALKAAA